MHDARFGTTTDIDKVRATVQELVGSVLRDADASIYLAQLHRAKADLAQRSVHTTIMSLVFGKYIGLPKDRLFTLGLGAVLCDVGMARVPQHIYEKNGPLTSAERKLVQRHVTDGVSWLQGGERLSGEVLDIISMHHERFDGTGYPAGRKGHGMPLLARMVQIAGVYISMTSQRPYAAPYSMKDALACVYEEAGKAFDVMLVYKFIACIGIFPPGCVVELASGEIGIVSRCNQDDRLRPVVHIYRKIAGPTLGSAIEVDLSRESGERRITRALSPTEYRIHLDAGGEIYRFELL